MNLKDPEVNKFFESLNEEALEKNYKSVCTWTKYKEDLEETKSILTWLPKKLKHEAMIPIGNKALMRGHLVHTNELLVNLGETWFVKRTANQTVDICNRRIERCNEMLERLEKERELIENKRVIPVEQDAFGSEERPEIIEHVTEEEDKKWREEHRKKEKEYREKLAELRNKEKKPIENEKDLWSHLDDLELQEELEDELNRLNAEDGSDEEEVSETSEINESITEVPKESDQVPNLKKNEKKIKRRVSFAGESNDSSDEEPLRLEIKHSEVEPSLNSDSSVIKSPSDIFNKYLQEISENPVSILKSNVNPNKEIEIKAVKEADSLNELNEQVLDSNVSVTAGIIFSDVVERDLSEYKNEKAVTEPRKVSKFKASRMKK